MFGHLIFKAVLFIAFVWTYRSQWHANDHVLEGGRRQSKYSFLQRQWLFAEIIGILIDLALMSVELMMAIRRWYSSNEQNLKTHHD